MIFQNKEQHITIFPNSGSSFLEQWSVPQEFPEVPGRDDGFILGVTSHKPGASVKGASLG